MAFSVNVSMRYSTHLPVLMEVMNRTKGDVLELGPGVFSTPVLHWMCETKGRNLLSIENYYKWHFICRQYYQTEHHKHLYVKNWDDADNAIKKEWDVVLVDHSPSGRRVEEIKKLANLAKYIVVHDSEPSKDKEYHYSTIYPLFKYRYDFKDADHNTVLLSNLVDLKGFNIYDRVM
jgi:hypothetical protein